MPKEAIFLVLGLQLATMLLATGHMILIRTLVNRREARLFLMEMTATFQLCTCNGFLLLLMDIHPQNQLIITYIYVLTTVHYILTLNENISNPACTFLYILRKGISVRLGSLKIVAQFVGAAIARLYFNGIYSLGISYQFSEPKCNPHQADFFKAFCIELVTSTMFQLAMLTSEQQQLSFRANRLAFVITSVVYTGGHVTGAIFNPALAFSLHMSCFLDAFWNYMLVYWVAPCLGSALVVVLWDEVLPLLRRQHLLG